MLTRQGQSMALRRHVCHYVLSVACSNARDLANKMVIYLCGTAK